ncbi:MAG: monovalent cation/H+ antiporter subunit D family protein [Pseudomonadota bacterium]
MSPEIHIILALLIPFVAAMLIPVFHAVPNLREMVTLGAAALLFFNVMALLQLVLSGVQSEISAFAVTPELELAFKVEPLGMLFACVAGTLWIVNSIYSIGYMRGNNEPRQTSFYVCFAIALSATMGIAFAENLFTLFVFYEVLTLSTYPLVTHKANKDAINGGRVYLILLLCTSMVLFLPAIIYTYFLTGTLDFTPGGILAGKADPVTLSLLLALFAFGIGKAALMPIHFWLPAAMVAPTPVSALLHAVAVVKAGVFCIVKIIFYIFGLQTLNEMGTANWLLYAAGFTVILASIIALRQDNLKKRLAYSTVSQLSYVILAASLFTPLAIIGAVMHIAAHAVSKITLFFAAGSIYTAAHLTEISQLRGIGRRMPWTMGAFTIGALSMIGLPPTAGFLGKWFMLSGAMTIEQWFAVGVIVISTILNTAYFMPIVVSAFFYAPKSQAEGGIAPHGEAPFPAVLALTLTALGTIALFLFPQVPYQLASMMIEQVAPAVEVTSMSSN